MANNDGSDLVKDYVVHVGFAKCGSTFLQQYFRDHSHIVMVKRKQTRHLLVGINDLAYDPTEARVYFKEFRNLAEANGRRPVYSNERLVGNVFAGHYDMQAIALRLKQVFEAPKIILMIRNQIALIASIYRQYLKVGGAKSFAQFIKPGDLRIPGFDWHPYEFHRLVEFYHRLFGPENVLVIPLEQIVDTPEAALQRICALCGVQYEPPKSPEPRNVGLDDSRLEFQRRINMLFRPKMPNLRDTEFGLPRDGMLYRLAELLERSDSFRSRKRDMLAEVDAAFNGRFRESNRRLSALTGIDFKAIGYEV